MRVGVYRWLGRARDGRGRCRGAEAGWTLVWMGMEAMEFFL